jgi:hypothetical protein
VAKLDFSTVVCIYTAPGKRTKRKGNLLIYLSLFLSAATNLSAVKSHDSCHEPSLSTEKPEITLSQWSCSLSGQDSTFSQHNSATESSLGETASRIGASLVVEMTTLTHSTSTFTSRFFTYHSSLFTPVPRIAVVLSALLPFVLF